MKTKHISLMTLLVSVIVSYLLFGPSANKALSKDNIPNGQLMSRIDGYHDLYRYYDKDNKVMCYMFTGSYKGGLSCVKIK